MLSLNARFDTISPAQYQRINQVSLIILIGSAAIAPAWLNIVAVAGFALMNYLGFKRMVLAIIEAVLGARPAPRQPERWPEDDTRQQRPHTGNKHLYLG